MLEKEVIYKIRGLPTSYATDELNVLDVRKEKIKKMVDTLPDEGIKLFTYGAVGAVIRLLEEKYTISEVIGIDYKEYFASMFGGNGKLLPKGKVIVVYDVGLEKAVNVEFSSRILSGLIKTLNNNNQHIIMSSELPYSMFHSKYGIKFNNLLILPTIEDIKLDI